MWSADEKFFHGKVHGDTIPFDDGKVLAQYRGAPYKIKELHVRTNGTNVIGLQAVYYIYGYNQTVVGPQNFGKEAAQGRTEVIHLKDDEFITEIFGRAGDIYDNFGIRTTAGRTFQYGGAGGNPFDLKAPYGKHFAALRGGFGGHIHNTDLHVQPLPWIQGLQPFQVEKGEFRRGKVHGDTVKFSDAELLQAYGGRYKVYSLTVFTDGKFIFGLQARYFVYGINQIVDGGRHLGTHATSAVRGETVQFDADEFITEVFGKSGDIFDNFGYATNKGRRFVYGGSGGDAWDAKAPFGRHFSVIRGGLGGHIHNVNFLIEPIVHAPPQVQEGEFRRGKTHGDTVKFSDKDVLKNYPGTHKIWRLTIFHDNNLVFGWKADYFVFGPNTVVQGLKHLGSHWKGGVEDVVELGPDEFIVEIFGRNGEIMDQFGFVTSKGRKFQFGGTGGNAFDAKAPKGTHFATLAGGLGGHVHNIEFRLAALPFYGFGGW